MRCAKLAFSGIRKYYAKDDTCPVKSEKKSRKSWYFGIGIQETFDPKPTSVAHKLRFWNKKKTVIGWIMWTYWICEISASFHLLFAYKNFHLTRRFPMCQIGAIRSLTSDCTKLRHRRMSCVVSKGRAAVFYHKLKPNYLSNHTYSHNLKK